MAVDIKKLLDIVQKRINNLDSSTVTLQELIDIANFTDKASNGTIQFVDDSSDLPNLENPDLPTAEGNRNLTFVKNSGRLFAKKEKWKPFTFRGLIPSSSSSGTQAQGSTSGYISGGAPPFYALIEKFPFSSDANTSPVGNLTLARASGAGQSSTASGYTSGGLGGSPSSVAQNVIDKFPFASDGNATDVGDMTTSRRMLTGQTSDDNGYSSGGFPAPGNNVIDKFPFSSDANATDVGDMSVARGKPAGQSSTTHGYNSGGLVDPPKSNVIDKFPFASDAPATDVGDLTLARSHGSGTNSDVSGYTAGAQSGITDKLTIDKFPFASDGNATDVGDLTVGRGSSSGQSSTTHGHTSGGADGTNVIDKFPFASDANATDVGDISGGGRYGSAGQQV